MPCKRYFTTQGEEGRRARFESGKESNPWQVVLIASIIRAYLVYLAAFYPSIAFLELYMGQHYLNIICTELEIRSRCHVGAKAITRDQVTSCF